MRNAVDIAKYFVKNNAETTPNTYDGNMKLQKLLAFADMIHIAEYGVPLYEDDVLAFKDGYVVEDIRQWYRSDYKSFKADSDKFIPDFNGQEYDVINATLGIFGDISARELSELSHSFESWSQTYKSAMSPNGYHDKKGSVVDFSRYPEDIEAIKKVVEAYKEWQESAKKSEVINGITFYYDDMSLTPSIIDRLEEFSHVCEDKAYTVYMDGERLVIY